MSLRFRKSIKLGNSKININKGSIGVTAGVKGAHITGNSKGEVTKSAGIPDTGISYRTTSKSRSFGLSSFVKGFIIICLAVLMLLYAWIPLIIIGIIYFIYCNKTQNTVNKVYVIIGILIFSISLGAFIFNTVNSHNASPNTTPLISTINK